MGALAAALVILYPARPAAAYDHTFGKGSLVIPMDLAYQDNGMLQAYGLIFQLLRQGVAVYWVIDEDKKWHKAPCDTAGKECDWDCWEEGSGIKCDYPTASPDFYTGAKVLWDGDDKVWDAGSGASTGDRVKNHGYRGGPFVIDAPDDAKAKEIIDIWNDQGEWPAADRCPPQQSPGDKDCWARRSVFQVVTVHETTASFVGTVGKRMVAAPTIAVFSDGHEDIATGYLRAAGIPQSNGNEFPPDTCGDCGPGTPNPDMLTVRAIMGPMGTCSKQNYNHKNGALFTDDGVPAFCQIMSMHWDVGNRNKVTCGANDKLVYHGHEVVAEVRQFLTYPTHFFAECQAVNAYENTVPDPEAPYFDDEDRMGHFLTTIGYGETCTNNDQCADTNDESEGGFECTDSCSDGVGTCCEPKGEKERGAGFLVKKVTAAKEDIQVFSPQVAYNQFDGWFGHTGGSEPAYNLSKVLGTEYKNNRDITFLSAPPTGRKSADIWMTGYLDGTCEITAEGGEECEGVGKVSYLGGHQYKTDLPVSGNWQTQGTRLFLNALFEADCVTAVGQPSFVLDLRGKEVILTDSLPVTEKYMVEYENLGIGPALEAVLTLSLPADTEVDDHEAKGNAKAADVDWSIGSVGSFIGVAGDPDSSGSRWARVSFKDEGDFLLKARIEYRVGVSTLRSKPVQLTVRVAMDSDGDQVPDDEDPFPEDSEQCGDSDNDTCDDCSVTGTRDPANDGPDRDGDGLCDAGDPDPDVPNLPEDGGVATDGGTVTPAMDGSTPSEEGGVTPAADGSVSKVDGGDGGEGDEDEDGSGCQCNAAGSSAPGLLHLFAAFAWMVVFRRRSLSGLVRGRRR
jgi:uncharacterized protein (TIGR03382 family)